jgi:hypothetical protein
MHNAVTAVGTTKEVFTDIAVVKTQLAEATTTEHMVAHIIADIKYLIHGVGNTMVTEMVVLHSIVVAVQLKQLV